MLFFFNRLTFGLSQQVFVKWLGVACVVTYISLFLTITLSCHPIRLNWQVRPLPPEKCTVRIQNFYTCTVLNVVTDAALLAVPLPLLWKLRISVSKKIGLSLLLGSGIFVITAAIVRIVMTLDSHPSALTINRWGVRETIAGIAAVNAPILKPLFVRSFWTGNFCSTTSSSDQSQSKSGSGGKSSGSTSKVLSLRKPQAIEMISFNNSRTNVAMPPHAATPGDPKSAQRIDSYEADVENSSQDQIIPIRSQSYRYRNESIDLESGRIPPPEPHPGVSIFPAPEHHEISPLEPHPGESLYTSYEHHIEDMPSPERAYTGWHEGRGYDPWGRHESENPNEILSARIRHGSWARHST